MPSWSSILPRSTTSSATHHKPSPGQKLAKKSTTLEPQMRYDWGDGQVTSTSESAKEARTKTLKSMPRPPYKAPSHEEQIARLKARRDGTSSRSKPTRREWNA